MESATDYVFSLLRFLGLLDERPPIRKTFKRNRVCDDFSSDDNETPIMGYNQIKKFRFSSTVRRRYEAFYIGSNYITNAREQITGSYTTSTPEESGIRTVAGEQPGLSSNEPSSLPCQTTPAVNIEVDGTQEEPQVTWVESKTSKNTKTEPVIVHVDLENINKTQQDDDVVFVEEVTTPPPNRQFEYSLLKQSHAAGLKDKATSNILEDTEPYNNLHATSIKITSTSKRKLVGDGKLAKVAALSRLSPITRINLVDDINLDNELNANIYHNATKEHDSIRVPLRASSDYDVEEVSPESTTIFTIKKDLNKDLTGILRNCPQELGSYNELQRETCDARRVSEITSMSSQQYEAPSCNLEPVKEWLAKMEAKYFPTPVKTVDKLNEHEDLSIVSKVNSEQNQTQSYKPDTAGDRVLKLEPKNNSGLLKSQETFNDARQESNIISKVNTEQNEAHSANLNNLREWLASLKSTYVITTQKTREDLCNAGQKSDIVPKVNIEQDGVYSINLNTSNTRGPLLKAESENETDLHKAVKRPDAHREPVIVKMNSKGIEDRSYSPSISSLKYKSTTQKNVENFDDKWLKLNNTLKDNSERNEVCSLEMDSTEDWLSEHKCNVNKTQEQLKEARVESALLTKISEQNEICSLELDSTEDCLSERKYNVKKTQEKLNEARGESALPKVISEQNTGLSFNTSEDLILKLGNVYENYQQETQEKHNKPRLSPDNLEQVSDESQQSNELSNAKSIIVEIQDNTDLPALTPGQEKLLDRALEPEPEEEILVEKFNIKIHRRDLITLADLNWLNDGVINFYMNLLMQRSEERKDLPNVYTTNTFFYPKLMRTGQPGLRRWTRKVDIFAYDLFMVPVNVDSHWCISVVDFRTRIIMYLNSGRGLNQECLDALLQYLKDEHRDKKGSRFDASGWKTMHLRNIPRQSNGSDCGMFACTFAEFTSRDAAYTFTQAHMPYLRRKAALEILMGKLLL